MPSSKYDGVCSELCHHLLAASNIKRQPTKKPGGKTPPHFIPLLLPAFAPAGQTDLLLLAGSGLAIILIVALALAILILLLFLRRSKSRRQDMAPVSSVSGPPAAEAERAVATALAGADESTPLAAPKDDPLATIPVGTITADQIDTSPRMTALKVLAEPQTVPFSGQRPANIGWQVAGLTDVGLRRDHNEDSLLLAEGLMADDTPYGLYVVADGLGGHQGGEIASQLSIEAIQEKFGQHPLPSATAPVDDWLKEVALAANQAILSHQEDQSQAKKMGSTLVMALVAANQAHIANVGDSRAYHLNEDGIHQISVDHSLVERLVQIGQLTRDEARTHKNRNVIYNTLGDKADPEIGLYHIPLAPGERVLLCSDGLSDMVTDEELLAISRSQPDPAEACKRMVEAANAAGGNDNITVIIVQIDA